VRVTGGAIRVMTTVCPPRLGSACVTSISRLGAGCASLACLLQVACVFRLRAGGGVALVRRFIRVARRLIRRSARLRGLVGPAIVPPIPCLLRRRRVIRRRRRRSPTRIQRRLRRVRQGKRRELLMVRLCVGRLVVTGLRRVPRLAPVARPETTATVVPPRARLRGQLDARRVSARRQRTMSIPLSTRRATPRVRRVRLQGRRW